jgi:type VI protein secretion system component VasF
VAALHRQGAGHERVSTQPAPWKSRAGPLARRTGVWILVLAALAAGVTALVWTGTSASRNTILMSSCAAISTPHQN